MQINIFDILLAIAFAAWMFGFQSMWIFVVALVVWFILQVAASSSVTPL